MEPIVVPGRTAKERSVNRVSTNRTKWYTIKTTPQIKDSDMENAALLLLIDSKLDELKNREMVSGAEIVDFLLDLRNAASAPSNEEPERELISN